MGNTENADQKQEIMTGKEYRSIFWRSFTIQSSWSFDKMMAYGYMYAIEKPLRKIYPNDDDYYAALKRHTETFNITPHVSPFLMGLGVAMEEQNAKSEDFDAESVNTEKINRHSPYLSITLHKCYPYYLFGISTFPNSAYHTTARRKFSITIV